MARKPRWRGFYFITDSGLSVNGIVEDTRMAIEAGVALVQYREKNNINIAQAQEIQKLCGKAGVPFIVNDDAELAIRMKADGVHVGQEDAPAAEARRILGPEAIVGVSVRTVEEVRTAERAGADYLAASAVFPTSTKLDTGPAVGIEGVRTIRAATDLTLAAIGGLNRENISAVIEAGADLICAISASLKDGKVRENIRELIAPFGR